MTYDPLHECISLFFAIAVLPLSPHSVYNLSICDACCASFGVVPSTACLTLFNKMHKFIAGIISFDCFEWIHMCFERAKQATSSAWCDVSCDDKANAWYVIKNVDSPSGCHLSLNNKNIKIMSFVYGDEEGSSSCFARAHIIETTITIMFIRKICHW